MGRIYSARYVTMLLNDYRRKSGVLESLRRERIAIQKQMAAAEDQMKAIEKVIRWFLPNICLTGEIEVISSPRDLQMFLEPPSPSRVKHDHSQMAAWVRNKLQSTLKGPPIPYSDLENCWFESADPPYTSNWPITAARRRMRAIVRKMVFERYVYEYTVPSEAGPVLSRRRIE